jgi:hypothetical protein
VESIIRCQNCGQAAIFGYPEGRSKESRMNRRGQGMTVSGPMLNREAENQDPAAGDGAFGCLK